MGAYTCSSNFNGTVEAAVEDMEVTCAEDEGAGGATTAKDDDDSSSNVGWIVVVCIMGFMLLMCAVALLYMKAEMEGTTGKGGSLVQMGKKETDKLHEDGYVE